MSAFITIDYDFFIRHGMFEDVKFPDGSTVPGELVFDWQMDERRDPYMDDVIWRRRVLDFQTRGLDIQEMTKPELPLPDFAQRLGMEIGDSCPNLYYGDSHGWAAILARDFSELNGPLDVINFDAHHDLGYTTGIVANHKKTGKVHCDDWALIGLAQGWIANYILVYPDWLGQAEWLEAYKHRTRHYRNRITVTTWSEWKQLIVEPEVMYFCRSSAWVPPWYDPGFTELHEEFGHGECLDCLLGNSGSPYHACKEREWDWDDVQKEIDELCEMRDAIITLHREMPA